jgi:hypothetical protein
MWLRQHFNRISIPLILSIFLTVYLASDLGSDLRNGEQQIGFSSRFYLGMPTGFLWFSGLKHTS